MIGAHYDTRPLPDQESDPDRHNLPFVGANDGASGVALLMEIANHLARPRHPWGVDLVLFDGEELVYGNDPRRRVLPRLQGVCPASTPTSATPADQDAL